MIDNDQRRASFFYEYKGEIIKYSIYVNDTDSSFGQKKLDKIVDEYEINNNGVNIDVEEYDLNNSENKRYIAKFKYRDVHYQIKGVMGRSEFDSIIKKLIFV